MRFIKSQEDELFSEALDKKRIAKNPTEFWKEIKHMSSAKTPLSSSIDSVSGTKNIAEFRKEHFKIIFNSFGES